MANPFKMWATDHFLMSHSKIFSTIGSSQTRQEQDNGKL